MELTELDTALGRIAQGAVADDCESDTLDFKTGATRSENDLLRSVANAAICFANASGGVIAVGVADRTPGVAAFNGTTIAPSRFRERIYELTRPHLNVTVTLHASNDSVVVVEVPASSVIHADTTGRATQRIGKTCQPLTPQEIARLDAERRGLDWSADSSTETVASVEPESLVLARRLLGRLRDARKDLATATDADLLRGIGAIDANGNLNNAGVLMFTRRNVDDSLLYQFKTSPGGEPTYTERIGTPLVNLFDRTRDLFSARKSLTPINLPSGQQISIEDFPEDAMREALSNAICHRDYHLDRPVVIDHSPEVLSIESPGPLVNGVTPTNILTIPSRPRNRKLLLIARTLGLAEELGRGIDRMYREMIRNGRPVPTIATGPDHVRVTMVGGAPDTNIAKFVAGLPVGEQDDTDTLLTILTLCQKKAVSSEHMSRIYQKGVDETEIILRRLAADPSGILEVTPSTANRRKKRYRLRPSNVAALGHTVAYNRRDSAETDRKIIAHIKEYNKITNKTIRNMFDVHMIKARDIIRDLSKRGLIIRTSVQKRGPMVEWGAGPNFPMTTSGKRKPKKGEKVREEEQQALWPEE